MLQAKVFSFVKPMEFFKSRFDNQQLWQDRTAVLSAAIGYLSSGSIGFVVGLDLSVVLSNLLGNAWK